MALKLMYITNDANVAQIVDDAGVDRVFIDLETVGKQERQGGMDTVQSKHCIGDIAAIKGVLKNAELLVRSNPIYEDSKNELNAIINNGADIVMLPYFKTVEEVKTFLGFVDKRVRTCLLFETPESVELIDEILELDGIDEVYVGLNDLSLGYGKKFMFELLADGTVEKLCLKFKLKGVPYGFGGVAAIGTGMMPAEAIIKEHYRLGSECVILSRCFCDCNKIQDLNKIRNIFNDGIKKIRDFESEVKHYSDYFNSNCDFIAGIISNL